MSIKLDKILAEISAGELIDKITILEIKKININDKDKLIDVEKELNSLNETFRKSILDPTIINDLTKELKSINLKLWDIENKKRLAEKNKDFGKDFVDLARTVYKTNDARSKIKLKINNILKSNIKEVKSHY